MKIKIVAILAALCVCVLVFSSCKQNEITNEKNENVQQNEVKGDEIEIPAPEYTIKTEPLSDNVSLKDSGELIFSKTVERVRVTAQHEAYVEAAKKIAAVMKRATDRNEAEAEALKDNILNTFGVEEMTGLPWSLEAKYEMESTGGKVVCIIEHIYHNAGGAYPIYADFAYNFDAVSGTQLYLDAFMPEDEDKFWEFEELLRKKLDEKYPETVQDSFIQTTLTDMAVDTWHFTETGMKIWFNEQELAPHAAGKLEIELTKDELPEGALKYFD